MKYIEFELLFFIERIFMDLYVYDIIHIIFNSFLIHLHSHIHSYFIQNGNSNLSLSHTHIISLAKSHGEVYSCLKWFIIV